MPEQSSLAKWLALALMIAVICNGASFYLKRTGVVDAAAYRDYWTLHCAALARLPIPQTEPQCTQYTSPVEIARHTGQALEEAVGASARYVYAISPAERVLKLLKDFFWLALVVVSCWALMATRATPAPWRQAWPIGALVVCTGLAFLASIPLNGLLIAAAGLRSFAFLFAALLGQWLIPHMRVFTRAVALLLVVELVLMPFEMIRGIHLFREWTPWALASRLTGTLVQPNSLGVFAISALTFYYCFSLTRAWAASLGVVALALVLLSGSGTGLVCAAVLFLMLAMRQSGGSNVRKVALLAGAPLLAGLAFTLPFLTGREELFASLGIGGRWTAFQAALFERQVIEVIFGSGLGVNTNVALNLGGSGGHMGPGVPTDSTLTGLLIQIGIVGTLLFYASLLWAARRDPVARPFYVIAALCTLTINVTELFPLNVLLGLALAHSAWRPANDHG